MGLENYLKKKEDTKQLEGVFWLNIVKDKVYSCNRHYLKLFSKIRGEIEFRPQVHSRKFFSPLFWQYHYHKPIATIFFFPPISAMTLPQIHSTIFFF